LINFTKDAPGLGDLQSFPIFTTFPFLLLIFEKTNRIKSTAILTREQAAITGTRAYLWRRLANARIVLGVY